MRTHNKLSLSLASLLCVAAFSLGTQSANAVLLVYLPFDGGNVGQTLSDTSSIGASSIGFVDDFDAFTTSANSTYVAGLSGSLTSTGNALRAGPGNTRFRAIIDRTTPEFVSSGVLEGPQDLLGADGTSIYGSVLIENTASALGFTGLEFAIGDPNANRKITIGEADNTVPNNDFVVIGPGQAGQVPANDLTLPSIAGASPGAPVQREILFRIDFGAANSDTFTLINPDFTDGASGPATDLSFSTLHLASFSGAPGITYDEIRIGTTLADVTLVEACDVNGGGCDLTDFEIIRSNFFMTGASLSDGDLTGDGVVDFLDFRSWKVGFLANGGSAAEISWNPVPEPTSVLLLMLGSVVGVSWRSKRRSR